MFRFILILILALGIAGGVAWYYDLVPPIPGPNGVVTSQAKDPVGPLGNLLYPAAELPAPPPIYTKQQADPIVIPGHLSVIDKIDISCQLPGQLLFIGERVPDGAEAVAGMAPFLAEPFQSTRILRGGRDQFIPYRRFFEGQTVHQDQMVAMLDFSKAYNELVAKRAKVKAVEAEHRATFAILKEAEASLEVQKRLLPQKGTTLEEVRRAQLTRDKYLEESISKGEEVELTKIDVDQATIVLKQHEILNKIPVANSIIQTIYKNRGEALKDQEPVMHLYSLDRLLAEALVEVQYLARLREGMPVILEPLQEEPPLRVWKGHRAEVTSVAVGGRDPARPFLLSASEDRTVCVWVRDQVGPLRLLKHPQPVRVVAGSPPGSSRNLCLSGDGNGTIRLWDLDQKTGGPLKEIQAHNDAVTALAFSADGKFFASGGAEGSISLWRTDPGELIYPFTAAQGVDNPHQGGITAVHFTPQTRLVSASRDNTLRVWQLYEKGPRLEGDPIAGRGGLVSFPGVSLDGRLMVFDQGKVLQLLSVEDARTVAVLQNPAGAVSFETLALFSPDGSLMLTAGAAEGRLQLWRTPTETSRGFEIRQLVTAERAPVTCAAFVPSRGQDQAAPLAISGSKDGYVYLWAIPTPGEVEQHRLQGLRLTLLSRTVDASSRQGRIGLEVRNPVDARHPHGRLMPGRPVTIVIEP